jgi:hypothetical protein
MLFNLLVIGVLATAVKMRGRPLAFGLVYFLIILVLGLVRGNPLGGQLAMAVMFSFFPVVALLLVSRFRESRFIWVVLVLCAAVANDLLDGRFRQWQKQQRTERPAATP